LKKLAALLALSASALIVVACGSSTSNPEVTPDNLAASMDKVCADANADFEAMGTRGLTNPQIALEFDGMSEVRRAVVDGFDELNLNDAAKQEIEPYIAASEQIIAQDKEIAKAAADDDTAAVNKGFKEQQKVFEKRDEAAKELGTEVCGRPVKTEVEATGTKPPSDLSFAPPKNTTEEAADDYVAALKDGDCAKINQNRHADAGEMDAATCEQVSGGFQNATVRGTEDYGPVGQAEIVAAGTSYPTFFVEDADHLLRYGADAINDNGGLRPAPEGNDSQETIDAAFAAIRGNDGAAFNKILPDESSRFWLKDEGEFDSFSEGKYNKPFVKDVRDGDGDPVQLGLNSTFGFYYYEGTANDWVLTTVHIPGLGGHYRFSGYWPVPKP
jgi:hypothetical protein